MNVGFGGGVRHRQRIQFVHGLRDWVGSVGATFTSVTNTLKLFEVLNPEQLSVTNVMIVFVLGLCASVMASR